MRSLRTVLPEINLEESRIYQTLNKIKITPKISENALRSIQQVFLERSTYGKTQCNGQI